MHIRLIKIHILMLKYAHVTTSHYRFSFLRHPFLCSLPFTDLIGQSSIQPISAIKLSSTSDSLKNLLQKERDIHHQIDLLIQIAELFVSHKPDSSLLYAKKAMESLET